MRLLLSCFAFLNVNVLFVVLGSPALAFEPPPVSKQQARQGAKMLIEGFWYRGSDIIRLPEEFSASQYGDLIVIIDSLDITSFLDVDQSGKYLQFVPNSVDLGKGRHKLTIYSRPSSTRKEPDKTFEFGILDGLGFERTSIRPAASFDLSYQPYFESSGSTLPPPNPDQFANLDFKLGLESEIERSSWVFSTKQNWLGSSRETNALRFSVLGAEAPKLDLSNYEVSLVSPSTTIVVGHVSNMSLNPLLTQSISNRGVFVNKKLTEHISASLTAQSGRSITGYDNLLGFDEAFNNIYAAQIAVEPFHNREHLSLNIGWLKSQQPAQADFDIGQVPSAEASEGIGISLKSALFDNRLTGYLNYASSTYSAPAAQEVDEFGFQNVFLESSTNQAYAAGIELVLAKSDNPYASSLKLNFGQYDPQYKVISGFSESDKRFWDIGLEGRLNSVSYSLSGGSYRDNLNNLPFALATRNDSLAATLSLPLQLVLHGGNGIKQGMGWLPDLNYTYTYGGQYGINNPISDPESFFTAENQIPKQYTIANRLGMTWDLAPVNLAFSYTNTFQNNEQDGRQNQDLYNSSFELNLTWTASPSLTLSPRLSYTKELAQLPFIEQRNLQHGFDLSYQASESLAFSSGYSYGNQSVSTGLSSSVSWLVYAQASYSFKSLFRSAHPWPGSVFVRINYASQYQEDILSFVQDAGSNFWINTGFSLKFF